MTDRKPDRAEIARIRARRRADQKVLIARRVRVRPGILGDRDDDERQTAAWLATRRTRGY